MDRGASDATAGPARSDGDGDDATAPGGADPSGPPRWLRLVAVLAVAAIVGGLWASGALADLGDVDALEERLTGSGVWGPLLFTLAFVAIQPVGVPGVVFALAAAAVWSPPVAFVVIWAGGVGASVVGFAAARWLARDWIAQRLPPRVHVWDQRLAERPLPSVILLRLLTYLAPWADWALGVSRIGVRDFLVGTVIGLAPMSLAIALAGDAATRWVGGASPVATAGALALVVAAALLGRRVVARRTAQTSP